VSRRRGLWFRSRVGCNRADFRNAKCRVRGLAGAVCARNSDCRDGLYCHVRDSICEEPSLTAATPAPAPSGTWKDPQSGLMWQVNPTGARMTRTDAVLHCESLSLGGFNDWRLPTISQLRSLIRGCPATQKGGSCELTDSCLTASCWDVNLCGGCSNHGGPGSDGAYWPPELSGEVNEYWSSSDPDRGKNDSGWIVSFSSGGVLVCLVPPYAVAVRCVR